MHRAPRLAALAAATLLAGGLAACSDSADADEAGSGDTITIEHAFGTTTIEGKPERVATVDWANHEVPLALGVVPVGMAAANFGDDDGDGLLPWVRSDSRSSTRRPRCCSTRPTASTSRPSRTPSRTSSWPATPG